MSRFTPLLGATALLGVALVVSLPLVAQTGRVVSPADTVEAVNPSFPADEEAEKAPVGEGIPAAASAMSVLQGQVAALEGRVERLEETIRFMGNGAPRSAPPMTGITENDPAVAETGVVEGEIQAHNQRTEELSRERDETAEEFDQRKEEQRRETQLEIRNRVRNAELHDGDAGSGY